MSRPARHGRRRRHAPADDGDSDRWLLTYADMITLLMALFMVLFSISSVNVSKYETLQRALKEAFSGGSSSGIQQSESPTPSTAIGMPALTQTTAQERSDDEVFRELKRRIDAYARAHGISDQLQAVIARRGLFVRLLTDRVLFDSGEATLKPQAVPLLTGVGGIIREEVGKRDTVVEGHTDDVPIRSVPFPSNWELSTVRATTVVRFLIERGADDYHLSAAGMADTHPIATNDTAAGRHRNRRVEIVVLRSARGRTS